MTSLLGFLLSFFQRLLDLLQNLRKKKTTVTLSVTVE